MEVSVMNRKWMILAAVGWAFVRWGWQSPIYPTLAACQHAERRPATAKYTTLPGPKIGQGCFEIAATPAATPSGK
jgi:hypothetical protein